MRALQSDINRAFENFWQGLPRHFKADWKVSFDNIEPRIDVIESDNAIEVIADLPGFVEDDIEIGVAPDSLTIIAEHKQTGESGSGEEAASDTGRRYLITERTRGALRRVIALPVPCDDDSAEAKLKNGILTVTVAKAVPDNTAAVKRIAVVKA